MPRRPRTRTSTPVRRKKKQSFFQRFKNRVRKMTGWPWFKKRRGYRGKRNWRGIFQTLFVMGFWGIIFMMIAIFVLSVGLPDIRKAVLMDDNPMVIFKDSSGKEFARLGDSQGDILRVSDMSPYLIKAVVATEDRRFFKHWGVDPLGLIRAFVANARSGSVVQGGSTITQQLAKNLFLTSERTLTRKIKEALLALYLERRYNKEDILAAYLNRAYFGAGAYGVDSAARVYFNTSARDLTLEQSAMLAGLLKAPSRYSPDNDPKLTVKRTRIVIGAMVDAGYLRPDALKADIKTMSTREYNVGGSTQSRYFADWVMGQIEAYIGTPTTHLVVETTLDSAMQNFASGVIRDTLDKVGTDQKISQAAMITMRPDGAVVTMIGGKQYTKSPYNRAVKSARQPGSAFKPFVYLAALEKGWTPQTQIEDAPLKVGKYSPTNYDGKYHGYVTIQDAVAMSLNTVAVRVLQDTGIRPVIKIAQRMGITDPLTNDLSLALGASEVHMLSLTSAYATLANRGLAVEPYGIRKISTDKGQVLYERRDIQPVAVLNPYLVAEMNQMLQSVVIYGTGQRAMIDRPVAGKTGTTSNYRDAWFVGYTADLVGSVWVGNDDNTPMKRVTGGAIPAQIWRDVMMAAHRGLPVRPLATTSSVAPPLPGFDPQGTGQPQAPNDPQGAPQGDSLFDRLLQSLSSDDTSAQPPKPTINWN